MIAYLDTSVIVALLTADTHQHRAEAAVTGWTDEVAFSDWGAVEFASAIARRMRTRAISEAAARIAFGTFDAWADAGPAAVVVEPPDFDHAGMFLRRLDLTLRGGDAIHIAVCMRLGAGLMTLDELMQRAATTIGCPVLPV